MKDLNFNIYALAAPSTPSEYMALLDEALRMANELNEQIDCQTTFLEVLHEASV
ncbi:hypothetical protein AEP_02233 [Curvibacter sp. AEP1-3]|uniref:hypothetical protein n=1 Tax=Curvibacter sp. AEP1-3 TaxID=1844971 RepID=UPI000B57A885|nr:hypothetical protein [Curvibacter sp. AEP1-3]ARV19160.1 hypothetical protein AEP_02233 [Curvibacter sp. AEP1-3]